VPATAIVAQNPGFPSMIFRLLRPNPSIGTIQGLYGAIVAQARLPSFYLRYGVPDTVDGRFDLIVLHLFLVLRRLGAEPGGDDALPRQLVEAFCQDLDHNLREMGVGDLTVPRRMQGYVEALYGRSDAYRAALAGGERSAVVRALARNVYGQDEPGDGAWMLADYMLQAVHVLESVPANVLARGEVRFPDPDSVQVVTHG
jgi:cytochrome b pre-mRNA-processing protein 3